jgi:hypothetical protein
MPASTCPLTSIPIRRIRPADPRTLPAFQTDLTRHNACNIRVIPLCNRPSFNRLRRNTPRFNLLPRKIFFHFIVFYTRKNGRDPVHLYIQQWPIWPAINGNVSQLFPKIYILEPENLPFLCIILKKSVNSKQLASFVLSYKDAWMKQSLTAS